MSQSKATLICSSTVERARAAWSCVMQIDDQHWYHDTCYYELRGLTPLANDALATEIDAVIAGISQGVNAHGLTHAQIWVEHLPLLEVAQYAATLPRIGRRATDDDKGNTGREEYKDTIQQVKTFMEADWASQYTSMQRKQLEHFVEQLLLVQGQAELQWHQIPNDVKVHLLEPLVTDHRKAQSLVRSLIVSDHPETLEHMAFGRIVEGNPVEIQSVNDTPDLTDFGGMLVEDDPERYFTQIIRKGSRLRKGRRYEAGQPSRITRYPWVYAINQLKKGIIGTRR